jgi:methyl coenzyme M reductase alpha subunit
VQIARGQNYPRYALHVANSGTASPAAIVQMVYAARATKQPMHRPTQRD